MVDVGERRGAYRVLVGRREAKKQLGRLRHRWENNITVILQETGWDGMHGVHLAQNKDKWWALVNMVISFGSLKMHEISKLPEETSGSEEELFCMMLVTDQVSH
jgi:hypothetical protein